MHGMARLHVSRLTLVAVCVSLFGPATANSMHALVRFSLLWLGAFSCRDTIWPTPSSIDPPMPSSCGQRRFLAPSLTLDDTEVPQSAAPLVHGAWSRFLGAAQMPAVPTLAVSAKASANTSDLPALPALSLVRISVARNDTLPGPDTNSSYAITLRPESTEADVRAESAFGAIYALETLLQLLIPSSDGAIANMSNTLTATSTAAAADNKRSGVGILLCCSQLTIRDSPEYRHRGVLVDTGRRFWPLGLLKELLDAMAMNKMNVLHLHAAEEGGYRFPSEVYPELNSNKSRGVHSSALAASRHYSLDDVRDLIAYAAARAVRIVPEVDLPMHASELAPAADVGRGIQYCGGHDAEGVAAPRVELRHDNRTNATLNALRPLLDELCSMFPDPYLHLGMDEIIPTVAAAGDTGTGAACPLGSLAALEKALLQHVVSEAAAGCNRAVAWHDVLTTTNAASAMTSRQLVLNTWGATATGAKRFSAWNATRLGWDAIESSGMYLASVNNTWPDAWRPLWRDIAPIVEAGVDPADRWPPFTPQQRKRMLGGEVSLWCNNWCSVVGTWGGHSMCNIRVGELRTPAGAAMANASRDTQFAASTMGLLWPRTAAAAGAFWRFTAGAAAEKVAARALRAQAARMRARGVDMCPDGCSCSVSARCGVPYIV